MRLSPISLFSLALIFAPLFASPPNPGFESGLEQWTARDTMSAATADAARGGSMGLRISDQDTRKGSDLSSALLPVQPGQALTLTFQARAGGDFLGVYLWFRDSAGDTVKDPAKSYSDGLPCVGVKGGDGKWTPYALTATVPANAETVSIWIHSWGKATGTADLDDFALDGIAPGVLALPVPTAAPADGFPARSAPPVIILKLDDLRQTNGGVDASWIRVTDYLRAKGIKASVGIICQTLSEASPVYIDWIKQQHRSGEIEFWFHGWDHGVWTASDGEKYSEFGRRPFDGQWDRFARSQSLAREKLGFAFATFGPGGGGRLHQDAATAEVMAKDPDMAVWLYPSPIDDTGRRMAAAGKITVLDRVWAVNLESKVGQPDYDRFVGGYRANSTRAYFVLQGHPTHWAGPRFAEFTRIIDFLVAEKAVFTTPSGYRRALGGRPAEQVGAPRP